MHKIRILSGNALKLIAAAAMVIDHAALMFFPGNDFLRILGRLAFPIFAFMIAEGSKYTRNKARYFGQLFALAVACQIVYFLVDGSLYLSVLFTFSLALLMIFALQACKEKPTAFRILVFVLSVASVWVVNRLVTVDYGFWGCMVPLFATIPHKTSYDSIPVNILCLGIGLWILGVALGGIQLWALAALPLLMLYSGQRGKWKMKYFFYVFYPVHLALLQILAWILL